MEITVESSSLAFFGTSSLRLENAASIKELLLRHASILAEDPTLVTIVNGRVEKPTYVLHEGDRLRFAHLSVGG